MINCKNCSSAINEEDSFCKECGAQIIKERITIKSLFSNLLIALGWDSNFFITLRYLLYRPQIVLKEYIKGTRKKYANPFSFFAIITAISLFTFSQYSGQFIKMSTDLSLQQTELTESTLSDNANESKALEILGFESQIEFQKFQLKYYNFFAFLFLPLYTLMAFLVFGKPYNFGEHLLIITYLQSITTVLSLLLFLFSIIFGINMFGTGIIILPFFYYGFAYKKLYKLTFGKLLLKILKFIGIFILLMIIPIIIGIIGAAMKG